MNERPDCGSSPEYVRPTIEELGDLRELTAGKSGANTDASKGIPELEGTFSTPR